MKKILTITIALLLGITLNAQKLKHDGGFVRHDGSTLVYVEDDGIPDVLYDGNTVAWFKNASEDCTTDGQDSVTVWTDALNSETLEATDGTGACPLLDGDTIKFNGTTQFLNGDWTWNTNDLNNLYIVIRQDTWTINEALFGENTGAVGDIYVATRTGSPEIRLYGSSGYTSNNANLTVGDWGLIQVVITEGENDSIMINNGTPDIADCTSLSDLFGDGLMVGSHDGSSNYTDISVVEIICRQAYDNEADKLLIYNYLKNKYGF